MYKECSGCHKPYLDGVMYEEYRMEHILNHGTTEEFTRMKFCPDCQNRIKELLLDLQRK